MHSAQRPPGQYASQSESDLQIGSGEVQMPVLAQMHSSGIPTHAQPLRQDCPNWHWGHPSKHTYCCAKAGVRRLVRTGADQATAAPAPMRFSIDRREMLCGVCSSMESSFIRRRLNVGTGPGDVPAASAVSFLVAGCAGPGSIT